MRRTERNQPLRPRMQEAITELEGMILARYPEAQFQIERSPESARIIHLTTTVDVPDLNEVIDVVIDRLVELQVEEELPLYVIPIRPVERVIADFCRRTPPSPRPERSHTSLPQPLGGAPR